MFVGHGSQQLGAVVVPVLPVQQVSEFGAGEVLLRSLALKHGLEADHLQEWQYINICHLDKIK